MNFASNIISRIVNLALIAVLVANCHKCARAACTFGEPKNLGAPVNTSGSDGTPCISPDGLSLYFTSNRAGGSGGHDLWMTTRPSKSDNWSAPVNLGPNVNSYALDYFPSISRDALSLYFYSNRAGGRGGGDLWVTTRTSVDAPWAKAVNLGSAINSSREDVSPNISTDGLSLIFASDRPGGRGNYDLYISTRASIDSDWSAAVNLSPVINTTHLDVAPSLSSDGLVLFFHSIRPGGFGSYDIYFSWRQSLDSEWAAPVNIGSPVNSGYSELGPSLAGDGRTLYFSDHYINPPRPGGLGTDDIWEVQIVPIIDFNGDGVVNVVDFSKLAQYWGQDEPLVDIGPTLFGDGMVDIQDMALLAEHWLQEVAPVGLLAYWKLDDTDGGIAHDSIAANDGYGPADLLWHPEDGKVDGALELDGIDDFLFTTFSLNPADAPFSVFAWVKGGAPGQVIISQSGGANWLMADASEGKLMTELQGTSRFEGPLSSQTVITDGHWHRVGLTWDGSNRILYVDDVEVARDTQAGLAGSNGGFYFGAGKIPVPPSLWLGLLDDIRIYDRAVTP